MKITFDEFVDLMGQSCGDPSHVVEAWEAYVNGTSEFDMEISDNE